MVNRSAADKRTLRKFGVLMAGILAAIGALRWLWHGFDTTSVPAYWFTAAIVFLACGLGCPSALHPVFRAWMKLAAALNWLSTRALLGLVFYGIVTPTRGLMRLFGSDPLNRTWRPDAPSYWEDPDEPLKDFNRYRDQF